MQHSQQLASSDLTSQAASTLITTPMQHSQQLASSDLTSQAASTVDNDSYAAFATTGLI